MHDLQIRPLVEAALREDIRSGDVTTQALIPSGTRGVALMNFREDGVLCGANAARMAWEILGGVEVETLRRDGEKISAGETVLRVAGEASSILTGERVALNFMQRLSGIATLTRRFADATVAPKRASPTHAKPRPVCVCSKNTPCVVAAATIIVSRWTT